MQKVDKLYTDKITYTIDNDGIWDYNYEIENKHCVFPDESGNYIYRTVSSKITWSYFLTLYSSKEKYCYDSALREKDLIVYIVDNAYRGKKLVEKLQNGENI